MVIEVNSSASAAKLKVLDLGLRMFMTTLMVMMVMMMTTLMVMMTMIMMIALTVVVMTRMVAHDIVVVNDDGILLAVHVFILIMLLPITIVAFLSPVPLQVISCCELRV